MPGLDDLANVFTAKDKTPLYENGTSFGLGLLSGLFFSDIWRILKLPNLDTPINPNTSLTMEGALRYAISAGLGLAGIFGHVKGATAAGTGVLLGSEWAKHSAQGKYIGAT